MNKFNPTLLGAFVLGALALAVVGILSFGSTSFFRQPQRFLIYFDESVHGLDLGSAVKLRGVRVGRVVGVDVRYDAASRQSQVAVTCEVGRNVITSRSQEPIDLNDRVSFQRLIDEGLRAKLGIAGLATGLLFVELDFVDPVKYPAPVESIEVKQAVVPAIPSITQEFSQQLSEIMGQLKGVDFVGISDGVKRLLADTDRKVNELDVRKISESVTGAAGSLQALLQSPQAQGAFANLNDTLVDLRGLIARLDQQVAGSGPELTAVLKDARTTLEGFTAAAESVRRFVTAQGSLGEQTSQTLQQLAEAADSVQRLADFLERNPNALLTGRRAPK